MRKKDDTMRSKLLDLARQTAYKEGIDAINIRSLALEAGVAAGTVYNYFLNKDEIILALTEEYWCNALAEMKTVITDGSFCSQLKEIYAFLKGHIKQSAGKLMNSLGNAETAGQESMASMQAELELILIKCIEKDNSVRKDIWNETFTKEQFAWFTRMNLVMFLKSGEPDISFFITIIRQIIY
ncbi:MAG: TetR/AcrR family transcriptional regulator [Lachnospiraceae bacterium]|nr:TetR/AcrR family transcriptional regulator [Lachnospiraceae bacterium]